MGETLPKLRTEIDSWLEELFTPFRYPGKCEQKIVRDAVHGYIVLEPHEVAVLDSPPIQRLRYIHQTALAYLVYPSAKHTRFEHSLGVLKTADSMASALRARGKQYVVTDSAVSEIRLAALLHDVGHVLYSHLGESILDDRFAEELDDIREEEPLFADLPSGEILAHLIITATPFKAYLEKVAADYDVEFDAAKIAGYVIGQADDPDKYKADIINGPFDADKLDYVLRDCHFCGIKADIDIERLYHTVDIWESTGNPRYLVMNQAGSPILEQILFSKMMLYSAIYHHQKIRTLECMVRAIFEAIREHSGTVKNQMLRFDKITDFLRMTEFQFLAGALEEPVLEPMVRNILNRQLLKRCLMISMASVRGDTQRRMFQLDTVKTRSYDERKALRRKIFGEIPHHAQTSPYDLWLDLPAGPDTNEDALQCLVNTGESEPKALSDLFPSDDWLTSYELNKWRGHVFYVNQDGSRLRAADAAEAVLKADYGIEFEPLARNACKLGGT